MQTQSASALFDTHAEAERAVAELRAAGVSDNALSLVAKDGDCGNVTGLGDNAATDGHGSVLRGILGGGALGAGLGIAALAIPGVGPLVAAGAIAASAIPTAAAVGAAAGAAAGTLNETLVGHGIAEQDAGYYGERIGQGGVLLAVDKQASTLSTEDVSEILYRNGGHNSARSRVSTY
jgi:hypothetical protein